MAKFKHYNYDQRLMVPVSLEEQIIPGTLEYAIHVAFEDRLDLSCFEANFCNDAVGRPAYNPKLLLKLIFLAYSRGITSSRVIEKMCHENILFMAMTCDQKFDHSTIAGFVSSMGDEITEVFLGVLMICEEMGLLGGTLFALDGTKLPGNASKELSGKHSELRHKKHLFEGRLKRFLERHLATDSKERDAQASDNKHFQRQKRKLERTIKKITHFLKASKPRLGKKNNELKANVTDPDSAKMKTGNSGTIQGYNAQAFVDSKHQIIVAGKALNNSADNDHFMPMILVLKNNLKKIGYSEEAIRKITALTDSGYYSVDNIKFAEDEKILAYIPDNKFRTRDPRYAGQMKHRGPAKFSNSEFEYDEQKNCYRCPAGEILTSYGQNVKRGTHRVKQYVSREEVCQKCSQKSRCLSGKRTKRRTLQFPITGDGIDYAELMKKRIDSNEGREKYSKRFGIVEPVFANIKFQKGLRRISLRGKIKANIQWLIGCTVHNLEKIAKYGAPMR